MNKENERKPISFVGIFFRNKGFMKDLWWIQLVFLFLFLLGCGIYSYYVMKKQAQNLVGGSNYQDMSSHSKLMERNGLIFKLWTFFASDEELSKSIASRDNAKGKGLDSSGENAFASDDANAAKQLAANDMAEHDRDAQGRGKKSQGTLVAKAGTDTKIPKIGSSLSGLTSGGGGSKTSSFNDSTRNSVLIKDVNSFSKAGDASNQGNKTSAMESLKGAYKSSLQGTRAASADTAKNWIARSFDASGKPRKAIEYNEKAKKAFDRINPNSVTGYLRDEDMSLTNAESLPIPDVKPLGNDKATNEALKAKTAEEMEQKAKMDMVKGLTSSLGGVASAASGMSSPYSPLTLPGGQLPGSPDTWTVGGIPVNDLTPEQRAGRTLPVACNGVDQGYDLTFDATGY